MLLILTRYFEADVAARRWDEMRRAATRSSSGSVRSGSSGVRPDAGVADAGGTAIRRRCARRSPWRRGGSRPAATSRRPAGRGRSAVSGSTRATIVASPTSSSTKVSEPIGSISPTVAGNVRPAGRRPARMDDDVLRPDAERDVRPRHRRRARARRPGPSSIRRSGVTNATPSAPRSSAPRSRLIRGLPTNSATYRSRGLRVDLARRSGLDDLAVAHDADEVR